MAVFLLLSAAVLYAPLIIPLWRIRRLKWLVIWFLMVSMCLPHIFVVIAFYRDIGYFTGNGAGWDQFIWYFQTILVVLVANGIIWIAWRNGKAKDIG